MSTAEDVYRNQTSMLQWLRRIGHRVDFSPEPGVHLPNAGCFQPQRDRRSAAIAAPVYLSRFDGKPCPYCGREMTRNLRSRAPTRDHVRPKRAGGTFANGNCLVVCVKCNGDKGDMMLREFVWWLHERNDPRAAIVAKINPDTGLES